MLIISSFNYIYIILSYVQTIVCAWKRWALFMSYISNKYSPDIFSKAIHSIYWFYPYIKFKYYHNNNTKLQIYKSIDIHHNVLIWGCVTFIIQRFLSGIGTSKDWWVWIYKQFVFLVRTAVWVRGNTGSLSLRSFSVFSLSLSASVVIGFSDFCVTFFLLSSEGKMS